MFSSALVILLAMGFVYYCRDRPLRVVLAHALVEVSEIGLPKDDLEGGMLAAQERFLQMVPYKFHSSRGFNRNITLSDGQIIQIRYFLPENFSKESKYPLLIWLHGGGFCTGSHEGDDAILEQVTISDFFPSLFSSFIFLTL
jgi:acetyl esterase/lipase